MGKVSPPLSSKVVGERWSGGRLPGAQGEVANLPQERQCRLEQQPIGQQGDSQAGEKSQEQQGHQAVDAAESGVGSAGETTGEASAGFPSGVSDAVVCEV